MQLVNGFKLIYERMTDGARTLYATKTGIPNVEDAELAFGLSKEEIADIKLVYEKDGQIMVSFTGIPSVEDVPATITADGELVIGDSDEPVPPTPVTGKLVIGNSIEQFKVALDMSIDEVVEILEKLPYNDDGEVVLINGVDSPRYGLVSVHKFIDDSGEVVYYMGLLDGIPVFLSKEIDDGGNIMPAGWVHAMQMEDVTVTPVTANGIVDFNLIAEQLGMEYGFEYSTLITEMYSDELWNDVLIFKYGENSDGNANSTTRLTALENQALSTGIKLNTQGGIYAAQLNEYLKNLEIPAEYSGMLLLASINNEGLLGEGDLLLMACNSMGGDSSIVDEDGNLVNVLFVQNENTEHIVAYSYVDSARLVAEGESYARFDRGWQYLENSGGGGFDQTKITEDFVIEECGGVQKVAISEDLTASGLNEILVGNALEGEIKLAPFTDYLLASCMVIDTQAIPEATLDNICTAYPEVDHFIGINDASVNFGLIDQVLLWSCQSGEREGSILGYAPTDGISFEGLLFDKGWNYFLVTEDGTKKSVLPGRYVSMS